MKSLYSERLLALARAVEQAPLPQVPTARAVSSNPLCGDHIEVGVRIVDGRFEEVGVEAEACAVCRASASAMVRGLKGQPTEHFERLLEALERVAEGVAFPPSVVDVFAVLERFPSRRPCAFLPWRALERALHAGPGSGGRLQGPDASRPTTHKTTNDPWRTIQALRADGQQVALATLVSVEGSSPCPLGSRMIVSSSGDYWGSVSGGCVESAVVQAALSMLDDRDSSIPTGASRLLTYSLANSQSGEVGLVCGGQICVHLARAPSGPELDAYLDAQQNAASMRLIPLSGGEARLVSVEALAQTTSPLTRFALQAFDRGPGLFEHDGESWFVEPLRSLPRLVLLGATHIAQVLARLSPEVGLDPVVVDPRTAMANRSRFPRARLVCERPEHVLAGLLDKRSAVVALSHNETLDDPALRVALASDAFYVGALGSRKTQQTRLERLRALGLSDAELRRLRGPAGIPIGGKGAGEIALSILAEIVATRRQRSQTEGRVGAIVLAAGTSERAGPINKLLHGFEGEPMVRRVVRTVVEAGVSPCVVVLGHEADRVREVLEPLPVKFVVNESFEEGMGTSIAAGAKAMAKTDVDAAFVVLGDMPRIRGEDLERLRVAHCASTRHLIIVPEAGDGMDRRIGNPVLWPRRYFGELAELEGHRGAKGILLGAPGAVRRVAIDHEGVLFDIDTVRA